MTPARLLLVIRTALAAAVLACTALMIDYQNAGDPAFCGAESACLQVRRSPVGMGIAEWLNQLVPMTLPQLGVLIFVTLMAFSLFVTSLTRIQALAAVSTLGGLAAGGLIAAQASIHTFCLYCMIVDTSTVVLAISSLLLLRAATRSSDLATALAPAINWKSMGRWFAVLAVAVLSPFVWAHFPVVPALPASIQALQQPGKLAVVSFTDFQCPYCRKTHPLLTELRKRPDVAFYRYMVPLEMHPGAEPAALAYLCMPEDKRDAFADLLYAADEVHLTLPGVAEMAQTLGADGNEITACMASEATRDHLAADKKLFQSVGGGGLPTTYAGSVVVVGYDPDRYQRIMSRADGAPLQLPVWIMFVLTVLMAAWAALATLRPGDAPKVAEAPKPDTVE